MGLIKLKSVPDNLHRKLKSEAAMFGVTLEAYCVGRLLSEGGVVMDLGQSVGKTKYPEVIDGEVHVTDDSQNVEPKDKRSSVQGVRTGSDKQSADAPVGGDVRPNPETRGVLRTVHDPKTCRVHKCGMCAVKEK